MLCTSGFKVEHVIIRPEKLADIPAITEINQLAFGRPDEAELVNRLRRNDAFICSLVAEVNGRLAGHILFTPVTITHENQQTIAAGLGPLAVHPHWQNQGFGSALSRQGLALCRQQGFGVAVVLGHPDYYPRFGFETAVAHHIRLNFPVPDDAFMVAELRPGALAGVRGVAAYHPEFAGV
ncbi:MAG: GNAT family N-acetyltransferase [Anaerolineae bacterium]